MQQAADIRGGAAVGDLTENFDLTCQERDRSRLADKVNQAVGDRRREHVLPRAASRTRRPGHHHYRTRVLILAHDLNIKNH